MASSSGRICPSAVCSEALLLAGDDEVESLEETGAGRKPSFFSFFFFSRRRLRREATRTRKNSSRLEEKMARKFRRSSRGHPGVHGLLEHPPVEGEPGELPIQESFRARLDLFVGGIRLNPRRIPIPPEWGVFSSPRRNLGVRIFGHELSVRENGHWIRGAASLGPHCDNPRGVGVRLPCSRGGKSVDLWVRRGGGTGRHRGLKIPREQSLAGSSPALGIGEPSSSRAAEKLR